MIEKVRNPSAAMIMFSVLCTSLVAIAAMFISVAAFRAAADDAGRKSTQDAVCAMWAFQIPQPGEPLPTTDRGRLQAAKAAEEYRKWGCNVAQ